MPTLNIGKLASQARVPIDTIRYYERSGLLPEPQRRPSGYRVYDADAVLRLRFIRRAKQLGFTLDEIAELMALSASDDVKAVKAAAQARLENIETRIRELQRMRRGLKQLIEHCPGHGRAQDCPIINALNKDIP
ncbi:MAG TPA: MerR family transcriptional regulator [Stenotrophobium sp.]|jgi:MerR family copper efflux transcriptional regulator|nr:MerR family transcriptional regulator [Stenotrophobium sp.]